MSTQTLLLLCALHSFGFAAFHLAFWRLFDWPRSLRDTTRPNRAIVQIATLQLAWVFVAVGLACLLYPDEMTRTGPGRAILAGMALFWAIRCVAQLVWLRINHPLVHTLSALFALGVLLFAMPLAG